MNQIINLGLLLNRASVTLSKTITNRLSDMGYDLPYSQFVVLQALHNNKGALSQFELAALLCKDAAAIKRTVDNLEAKCLVKRHRISPKKYAVVITDKGREIIPNAARVVDSIIENALMGIPLEKREELNALLDNICNNLDNLKNYIPRM